MSKPVKELIRNELVKRFEGVTSLAVVGFTGLDAIATHSLRGRLHDKQIRLTVVKNSVARQAFKQLGLDAAGGLLDGPCAVAYGADSVVTIVRTLMDVAKETAKGAASLTIKAALLDGQPFAADQIEALSKYPNRDEAIARVVSVVLSGGSKLAACLIGPGGAVASILKTVEEKAKEAAAAAPAPEAAPEAPAAAAPEAAAPAAEAPAAAPAAAAAPADEAPAADKPA